MYIYHEVINLCKWKMFNDSERQWCKCPVLFVRCAVILVAEDRAAAGFLLYWAQHSPGLTIMECSAWTQALASSGPVFIQQFMELLHIDWLWLTAWCLLVASYLPVWDCLIFLYATHILSKFILLFVILCKYRLKRYMEHALLLLCFLDLCDFSQKIHHSAETSMVSGVV